ncbi:MAG: hypothetical protein WBM76_03810 [Woeseiaceae bacterium]
MKNLLIFLMAMSCLLIATRASVIEPLTASQLHEVCVDCREQPGSRLKDFGPSVFAEFCGGQQDPIVGVVPYFLGELGRYEDLGGIQAQSAVYSALRRHYPCTEKLSLDTSIISKSRGSMSGLL